MIALVFRPFLDDPEKIRSVKNPLLFPESVQASFRRMVTLWAGLALSIHWLPPLTAFSLSPSGASRPGARPLWTCDSKIHGSFSGVYCWVDKFSSPMYSRWNFSSTLAKCHFVKLFGLYSYFCNSKFFILFFYFLNDKNKIPFCDRSVERPPLTAKRRKSLASQEYLFF